MPDPTLPLIDLHRHLDGNIAPQTILALAEKHQIPLPAKDLAGLLPHVQVQDKTSDLLSFLAKLDLGVEVLADLDACYQVSLENVHDAKAQGLNYTELRFSPYYMAKAFKLPVEGVVEAVIAGVAEGARQTGVEVNLIGILSRSFGVDACYQELQGLLAHKDKLVGLDLAGDELGYPAPLFTDHFKQARDAGWQITVHAGEADGPQSIWNAIELLGATRIGHGVAAIRDEKLMDYMAKHRIAIEACPTSNYQTATVTDTAHHPMREFFDKGLLVTLNTDDPAVSGITLAHEYQVAEQVIGFGREALRQIQANALEAAFLSDGQRQALLNQFAQE